MEIMSITEFIEYLDDNLVLDDLEFRVSRTNGSMYVTFAVRKEYKDYVLTDFECFEETVLTEDELIEMFEDSFIITD